MFPLLRVGDTLVLLLLRHDEWDKLDHLITQPRVVESYVVLVLLVVEPIVVL